MASSAVNDDIFNTLKPSSIEKKFCFKKVLQNSKQNNAQKDNLQSTNISLSLKNHQTSNKSSTCNDVPYKSTINTFSSLLRTSEKQCATTSAECAKSSTSESLYANAEGKQSQSNSNFNFHKDVSAKKGPTNPFSNLLSLKTGSCQKPGTYSSLHAKVAASGPQTGNLRTNTSDIEKQQPVRSTEAIKDVFSNKDVSKSTVEQGRDKTKVFKFKKPAISEKPSALVGVQKDTNSSSCSNSEPAKQEDQTKGTKKFKFKKTDIVYDHKKIFSLSTDISPIKHGITHGNGQLPFVKQSISTVKAKLSPENSSILIKNNTLDNKRTCYDNLSVKTNASDSKRMCYESLSVNSKQKDDVLYQTENLHIRNPNEVFSKNNTAHSSTTLCFANSSSSTPENTSFKFKTKEPQKSVAEAEKVSILLISVFSLTLHG